MGDRIIQILQERVLWLREENRKLQEGQEAPTPAPGAPEDKVGPLGAVEGYQPKADRSHLRLGLTLAGMYLFLEEVGFISWEQVSRFVPVKSVQSSIGWKYAHSYQRSQALSWIETCKVAGPVEPDSRLGLQNMTGYDVCSFIRSFLTTEGYESLSICEVILTSDRFSHLRCHIGLSNVFWSHIQSEGLVGQGTLSSIGEACTKQLGVDPFDFEAKALSIFFWVDYFSLRQAQSDFNPAAVVELVRDIGTVVACIDKGMIYPTRTFCVLELYAAVAGGAKLVCHTEKSRPKVEVQLADKPVKSQAASTRDAEDKKMIDDYIISSVGFAKMDELVSSSITSSAMCAKHLRVRCPECYPGESPSPSAGY